MPSFHSSLSSNGVGNSSLLRCSQNDLMSQNEQDFPAWTAINYEPIYLVVWKFKNASKIGLLGKRFFTLT